VCVLSSFFKHILYYNQENQESRSILLILSRHASREKKAIWFVKKDSNLLTLQHDSHL